MTKTLEMVFRNQVGKEVTFSLADPRDDVSLAEVQAVMQNIIAKGIFTTKDGDLVDVVEARIRTRDTIALV